MQPTRSASPRHRAQGALLTTLVLALVAVGLTACGPSAAAAPAKPTWVAALPGNGATGVGWREPAQTADVTSYIATAQPGGRTCTSTKVKSCWVRGLANGKIYSISVRSVGPGGKSAPVTVMVTPGIPWPPTVVTGTPGDGSIMLTWSPNAFATGAPVTSYDVHVLPSDNGCTLTSSSCTVHTPSSSIACTSTSTACTVSGLANGASYRFVVIARNTFGESAPSAASLAAIPSTTAGGTPDIVYLGPVNANQESTSGTTLQRDAGISVALPDGRDLWIFGDTSSFSAASSQSSSFIGGSTAAKGRYVPGRTPTALKDIRPAGTTSSQTTPAQFIPTPNDTYMPDGSGRLCTPANGAVYTARWPTGAALLDNQKELLVTYTDVCVTSTTSFTVEGWGFMTYAWRLGKIKTQPFDVFAPSTQGTPLPADRAFQSPIVANGQVTFFSSACTSLYIACTAGGVAYTTVTDNLLTLAISSNYVSHPAVTDGSAQWIPVNVSVAAYPSGLRLIEQTSIGGTFIVFSAATPAGPWHAFYSGSLPGCSTTPTGFCYAFVGHPELGSNTSLLVSYFKPDSPNNANVGHVDLALVPLPAP